MTVCVAIRVNEGIVFAADSASSVTVTQPSGASQIINVYNHGLKVFNLYKRLPLCALTCGIGNFGSASIAALAKEFRYRLTHGDGDWKLNPENYTVEEVAEKAKRFLFDEKFQQLPVKPTGAFEFWVGGYPSDMTSGYELWKIEINNAKSTAPTRMCAVGEVGLNAGGSPAPINRLVTGFDPKVAEILGRIIRFANPDGSEISKLMAAIRQETEVFLFSPVMPIQDAIELAEFLVETTKRFYRFLPGADIVGGDPDIATVTRYEGFKWIRRKHYYAAGLNRMEDDHV